MKIRGGFVIFSRLVMERLAVTPPCTRELYTLLLRRASFAGPGKGTVKTSIEELCGELSWQIGYRRGSYSRDQMKTSLKALRTLLLIATAKTPDGMIITVNEYDSYQTPKNYENANESTNEDPTKPPMKTPDTLRKAGQSRNSASPNKCNKDNRYNTVINYLNIKTGKNYKITRRTNNLIDARLNERYTVDDFKAVIDRKSDQWLNTDMEKYLRPETLFGNKFESYLNEKTNNNDKKIEQRQLQPIGIE